MIKREAVFQTRFSRWLKYNWNATTCFELKYCQGQALPFASVKAHQVQNLLNVKHRKTIYKIPDDSLGEKPFDCLLIAASKGYVVIQYASEERPNNTFYMIDIDAFCAERDRSKRKSLTEARARAIGKECTLGSIIVL